MKTQSLSPLRKERLKDLITLADHPDRDQWHCLRCHRIRRGQFTASYSDIVHRWGVSPGVAYGTIKALIKAGYLKVERFEHASLFTLMLPEVSPKDSQNSNVPKTIKAIKAIKKTRKPTKKPQLPRSLWKRKPYIKVKVYPRSKPFRRSRPGL